MVEANELYEEQMRIAGKDGMQAEQRLDRDIVLARLAQKDGAGVGLSQPDIPKGSNLGYYFKEYVVRPMEAYVKRYVAQNAPDSAAVNIKVAQVDDFTGLGTGNLVKDIPGATVTITPSSDTAKILVVATVQDAWSKDSGDLQVRIRKGSTLLAWGGILNPGSEKLYSSMIARYLDSPASTDAQTYKVTVQVDVLANGNISDGGGRAPIVISAMEV